MTECADCGAPLRLETVQRYVTPDEVALALCPSCQTGYPSERQYQPQQMPKRSRVPIDGGADR